MNDSYGLALTLLNNGQVALAQGDIPTALERFREGLATFEQLGMPDEAQQVRELIAGIEQAASQPAESQLDRLRSQVREAMPQALLDDDAGRRAQFLGQLEEFAAQSAEGEAPGSPWMQLADYLRACAALLRGQPFDRSALLPDDLVALEAWERGEVGVPALAEQASTSLPEDVLAALIAGDDAALQAALDALPQGERAEAFAELQRQMAAQVEQLSPEEQRALRVQAQQRQIAAAAAQAHDLAADALRGEAQAREALAAQIAAAAEQAAAGEAPGSPYDDLAAFLRAVAALLRGEDASPVPPGYAAQIAALGRLGGE
jgi:hypothetical protein